jgi:hypothetical protein
MITNPMVRALGSQPLTRGSELQFKCSGLVCSGGLSTPGSGALAWTRGTLRV